MVSISFLGQFLSYGPVLCFKLEADGFTAPGPGGATCAAFIVPALNGDSVIRPKLVAYFTMEIALENAMPSYSGGLGVLAGDTIRAAADLQFPIAAVSLLYRNGYFTQRLATDGTQIADPVEWHPEEFLQEESARVFVPIENRRVELRCWRYDVKGVRGGEVPVYFLDSDLPSNQESDRSLTGTLYGGDPYYRLRQEVVLGIGGVRMLQAL